MLIHPFLLPRLLLRYAPFFLLLYSLPAAAQPLDPIATLAESLKGNVVAIRATFDDESEERGFGFITGEQNGRVYIATAAHVVRGIELNQSPVTIQVRTFFEARYIEARLIKYWAQEDLALLEMTKPLSLKWKKECADFSPENYQKVRFIGLNGSPPSWGSPGSGEIFEIAGNYLQFAIGTIRPGTSGAPLLTEDGIAGLITQDEGSSSTALKLSRIRELFGAGGQSLFFSLQITGGSPTTIEDSPVLSSLLFFKKDDLIFDVVRCRQVGRTIECEFKITNESREDIDLSVHANQNSRVIAAGTGYEYNISGIRLAEQVNSNRVSKTIVTGSTIKAVITFDNVAEPVQKLSKLQLQCYSSQSRYFNAEVRDIPVK